MIYNVIHKLVAQYKQVAHFKPHQKTQRSFFNISTTT
jgi:hypothetical protein